MRVTAVAAVTATFAVRNAKELKACFDDVSNEKHAGIPLFGNTTVLQFLRDMLLKGTIQDEGVFEARLRILVGEMTFLEAFEHSGKADRQEVALYSVSIQSRLKPQLVLR